MPGRVGWVPAGMCSCCLAQATLPRPLCFCMARALSAAPSLHGRCSQASVPCQAAAPRPLLWLGSASPGSNPLPCAVGGFGLSIGSTSAFKAARGSLGALASNLLFESSARRVQSIRAG